MTAAASPWSSPSPWLRDRRRRRGRDQLCVLAVARAASPPSSSLMLVGTRLSHLISVLSVTVPVMVSAPNMLIVSFTGLGVEGSDRARALVAILDAVVVGVGSCGSVAALNSARFLSPSLSWSRFVCLTLSER